ncbi:lysophospholipase [Saccharopolyspora erythraea]|uniref:alpha/beta hydrolase n=1 Tax=Saccharopolyspora erythraea TaxID=1836 RepID=UPI001BAAA585|nr:lysophospholipase [Saccharopolyspora erythraea]QUH02551.1 lysophospholipase [Saccharopolyspora erythraea]
MSTHTTTARWDEPAGLHARATVVLAVGRGENPAAYRRLGERLSADAYRVRIAGDATAAPDEVTTQVKALLDDESDPAPRVLAGSDAGALFALRLTAQRAVAPDALVLAGLPGPGRIPRFESWEDELRERTSCPTHRQRLTDTGSGSLAVDLPPQWHDEVDLSGITVPVLGLHGTDDAISPRAGVRGVYARMPASRLTSVAGGKHDVLNDRTHRSVAATIVLFLESLRQNGETVRDTDLSVERGIVRAAVTTG